MIERMIGLQGSIFDLAEECAPGPLDGMQRTELTRGAWVDHLPGWVAGSDEVLDVLLGDIGWPTPCSTTSGTDCRRTTCPSSASP